MYAPKKLSDILANNSLAKLQAVVESASTTERGPLPAGVYNAQVVKVEPCESRTKQTPGVKFTLKVRGGAHEGRFLWYDLWLTEPNAGNIKHILNVFQLKTINGLENPRLLNTVVSVRTKLRKNDRNEEFNENEIVKLVEILPEPPADPFAVADDDDLPIGIRPNGSGAKSLPGIEPSELPNAYEEGL
jgi:hypothetical protein